MENEIKTKNAVVSVRDLKAGYGGVKVLHGVTLEVSEGEITVLLGTNGNGKSTLLKCIAGLVTPQGGEISLREKDGSRTKISGMKSFEIVQKGISLIPEGRRLFSELSVEDNLLMGAFKKSARKKFKENLKTVYEFFPKLEERKKQRSGTLSGGEQQMLAVGRGLMSEPRVLLIDEPSIGLAPIVVSKLMETIRKLRDEYNLTILMSEQNLIQASKVADEGYIMVHGQIVFQGTAQELSNNDLVKKHYLIQ